MPVNTENLQVGRLALRVEGEYWNAYYAMNDSMDHAVLLGSIRMRAVVDNRARKQAFMDLMRGVVTDIIEERFGAHPEWGEPEKAPEHERSGAA